MGWKRKPPAEAAEDLMEKYAAIRRREGRGLDPDCDHKLATETKDGVTTHACNGDCGGLDYKQSSGEVPPETRRR